MAIRFDKDSRRAVNGPMIFFSDPSAEASLCSEIETAVTSRLSFYAYRRPGDLMITFGTSEGVVEGIGTPGFVIAPFSPYAPYLTIPYRPCAGNKSPDFPAFRLPLSSTPREQHRMEVEAIKEALSPDGGKIIAARVKVLPGRTDVGATFAELARRHPDAFVFCFSTPTTGCWLGASPELLLESSASGVETMALAGTRNAGQCGEWDMKNIEEQKMVLDFITDALIRNGIRPETGPTFSRNAGKIEHLCTPVSGFPEKELTPQTLTGLLRTLSPTPALCGIPRDTALRIIGECESFDRGYYGGFCGPYRSPRDFSFYVNLRSCLADGAGCRIFAGGGITLQSDADREWEETEKKTSTILDSLRLETLPL